MAFWKATTIIIVGVGLVAGLIFYQKANKNLTPKGPAGFAQQSTGSKSAPMPEWESKFHDVYRLRPFDKVKYIAPPYIPEREAFFREKWGWKNPDAAIIIWDGKSYSYHALNDIPEPLSFLLREIGLSRTEYDSPADLIDLKLSGDWILRTDVPRGESLRALEKILNKQHNANIRFQKKVVDEVITVRGKFAYSPLPNAILSNLDTRQSPTRSAKPIHIFTGPEEKRVTLYVGGISSMESFLDDVSKHLNYPIKDETEGDRIERISLILHIPKSKSDPFISAPLDPASLDKVLANLSAQTSLKFTKERRKMEVWQVTQR